MEAKEPSPKIIKISNTKVVVVSGEVSLVGAIRESAVPPSPEPSEDYFSDQKAMACIKISTLDT